MSSRTMYAVAALLFAVAAVMSFIGKNTTIAIAFTVLVIVFGMLASRSLSKK